MIRAVRWVGVLALFMLGGCGVLVPGIGAVKTGYIESRGAASDARALLTRGSVHHICEGMTVSELYATIWATQAGIEAWLVLCKIEKMRPPRLQ